MRLIYSAGLLPGGWAIELSDTGLVDPRMLSAAAVRPLQLGTFQWENVMRNRLTVGRCASKIEWGIVGLLLLGGCGGGSNGNGGGSPGVSVPVEVSSAPFAVSMAESAIRSNRCCGVGSLGHVGGTSGVNFTVSSGVTRVGGLYF
jgi:hypothetical protein